MFVKKGSTYVFNCKDDFYAVKYQKSEMLLYDVVTIKVIDEYTVDLTRHRRDQLGDVSTHLHCEDINMLVDDFNYQIEQQIIQNYAVGGSRYNEAERQFRLL